MLKINGTELPAPSGYTVGIQDISKADRNANGTIIIERIATKRKLTLAWEFLSANDLSIILNLVSSVYFSVQYVDPESGGAKTGTFYAGDRTTDGIVYKDGAMNWKNTKFDIIER